MPRTRTIKKGNRKGNRNVSRGNKYTLNRLKERNHKRTRKAPKRNYNNLPKRTRKQRAGAMLGRAANRVASGAKELGSKAKEFRQNIRERQRKNLGKVVSKPTELDDIGRVVSDPLRLGAAGADLAVSGAIGVGELSVEGASKLKKNLDRTCSGSPAVKIDILKPKKYTLKKPKRICGETKYTDISRLDEVNEIKQAFNLTNNNA